MAYASLNKLKGKWILRELPQRGNSNTAIDSELPALLPGKRTSANNREYWETRKNRSDAKGKSI